MSKTNMGFKVDESEKKEIEHFARMYGYLNASDLIRSAVREKIQELRNREPIFRPKATITQGVRA